MPRQSVAEPIRPAPRNRAVSGGGSGPGRSQKASRGPNPSSTGLRELFSGVPVGRSGGQAGLKGYNPAKDKCRQNFA